MSSFYPIIGLAGKQASGKTTASNYLAKTYNGASIALADPIKRFLFQLGASEEALWGSSEMRSFKAYLCLEDRPRVQNLSVDLIDTLGLSRDNVEDLVYNVQRLKTASIRDAAKVIGTYWGRNVDDKVWIRYGLNMADGLLACNYMYNPVYGLDPGHVPYDYVIINDLRFRNEILAVKAIGGLVLKINAKNDNKDQHVSETELDTVPEHWFDDKIFNNKDGTDNFTKELAWKIYKHFKDGRGI